MNGEETMLFELVELEKFLNHIKDCNNIILRHDVDLDLNSALRLAKLEKDIGVDSIFVIRVTGETYNPLSRKNRKIIKEIHDMGFRIGLHFDTSIYDTNNLRKLVEFAKEESNVLSSIINDDIWFISIHNPSIHGKTPLLRGFYNMHHLYNGYLSDSGMEFNKDPYKFLEEESEGTKQIILHPCHYTNEGDNYAKITYNYLWDFIHYIDKRFRLNSGYEKVMKGKRFRLEIIDD